jgi:hypothetical protein
VKRKVHLALKYSLAFGTLGYGLVSASRSQRFAELTGMDEEAVRQMAMRDVGSGLQILTAANPASALIARAFFDFGDAVKLLRKRPPLAFVAIAWGLLAVAAFFTRGPAPEAQVQES